MRPGSILFGLAMVMLVSIPASTNAAQSYKVPLTIVPGSVTLTRPGGPTSPAVLPISMFASEGGCSGTYKAEVVNGGLEVELFGIASNCLLHFALRFDVQITVPELGGSSTLIRLEGDPIVSNFDAIDSARIRWLAGRGGVGTSTVAPNRPLDCRVITADYDLRANWPNPFESQFLPLLSLIPGDTITCPGEVESEFRSGLGTPTSGRLRLRYEFRVTLPEPAADLTLPIGAIVLAGLSTIRTPGR